MYLAPLYSVLMRQLYLLALIFLFAVGGYSQTSTFITLSSSGQLAKVTVGAGGCTSTNLNLCSGVSGSLLSIALNGNLLYVVNNQGNLYSTTLNSTSTCNSLGKFLSGSGKIYGMTVDKNGKVYAANDTQIETYNPNALAGSEFAIVGNVPAGYSIGGDLLFYADQLYMSCSNNVLLAVDTLNPANSTPYLSFTSPNVFGFASVTVPCSGNQAYGLSTSGSSTNIVGVDMQNKTETGNVCILNYRIYDAASIAETQTASNTKTITTNFDSCNRVTYLGKVYTTSTVLIDTVRTAANCDSIYNIAKITIAPPAKNVAVSLFGCKNVIYKTKPYTTSTSFIDTITNKQGCDSVYNNVSITIAANAISVPVSLSDCKPVYYNNKLYKTAATFIDTLKSKQGCDSVYNNVSITITPLATTTTTINLAACGVVNYANNPYYFSTQINDTSQSTTGCDSAYKIINITVYPTPTIVAGSDLYVVLDNTVTLNPTITNASKIEWTPTDYLSNFNTNLVNCKPQKDIVYKIKATSKDGCADSAYQKIFVYKALNIPTAFSPNGDNINDTWIIEGLSIYPQNTVQVFNRYGQKVYTSFTGNYKPWDGKLAGNDLPVGVYYFIINLSAKEKPIAGSVILLR